MKLTPYADLLKMGKEALEAIKAPLRAREMKKQAELEMLKIEGKQVELQAKLDELASAYPVNFAAIIETGDELALIERRMKQYDDIIKQMFPEV